MEVCRPVLAAYAGEMRGLLSAGEVATLFDGIRVLPYELGVRFLTDHLEGDRYFRVQAHGENLHKALIQFSLGRDIDRQEATIRATHCRGLRCELSPWSRRAARPQSGQTSPDWSWRGAVEIAGAGATRA